jgi:hypothetical protein
MAPVVRYYRRMANPSTCPVCGNNLQIVDHIDYADHSCWKDDHFYGIRINSDKFISANEPEPTYVTPHISIIKLRLTENNSKKYIKIDYENQITEYWVDTGNRIRLNLVFEPNFSDYQKIFNKIKSLLIFA